MLDIKEVLVDLSGDTICGNNKEFDALFIEMEMAQKGKEEREMAGSVIEAEPPDWRLVKKNALLLAKETHDLRVAVNLISAMLNLHGFAGLEESSRLLVGLLEKYWLCLYPELDIDYGDAIARINVLRVLCDTPFYLTLKKQPLVEVRGIGRFSLNDIQGKAKNSDEAPPDAALIKAAFQHCELTTLQETVASVSASLVNINRINSLLQEKAEEDNTLNFSQIVKTLKEIEQVLSGYLQQRTGQDDKDVSTVSDDVSNKPQAAKQIMNTTLGSSEYIAPPAPISGEINNADDVLDMLEKINTYYQKHEPSSPIPLLLNRAKRLVNKDFSQLIEDLSPKTMKELEVIFGVDKTKRK
ncbi:MAG TPA: type VI secretion system protein TssA [Thiothrix sp.]|nr:type VI secretion system protein TssA [Thiothrix sp.]